MSSEIDQVAGGIERNIGILRTFYSKLTNHFPSTIREAYIQSIDITSIETHCKDLSLVVDKEELMKGNKIEEKLRNLQVEYRELENKEKQYLKDLVNFIEIVFIFAALLIGMSIMPAALSSYGVSYPYIIVLGIAITLIIVVIFIRIADSIFRFISYTVRGELAEIRNRKREIIDEMNRLKLISEHLVREVSSIGDRIKLDATYLADMFNKHIIDLDNLAEVGRILREVDEVIPGEIKIVILEAIEQRRGVEEAIENDITRAIEILDRMPYTLGGMTNTLRRARNQPGLYIKAYNELIEICKELKELAENIARRKPYEGRINTTDIKCKESLTGMASDISKIIMQLDELKYDVRERLREMETAISRLSRTLRQI